jgi:hypothetical protein
MMLPFAFALPLLQQSSGAKERIRLKSKSVRDFAMCAENRTVVVMEGKTFGSKANIFRRGAAGYV